ncbi:MAG: c-type cytochrome [Saprospiraceae bacterium]|nr:c-type cytochrome [Saprospiraceae bacterium]
MSFYNFRLFFYSLLLAGWFISCQEKEQSFVLEYPDYFPKPVYGFDNNPLTREGFILGRELFFDPILSADNSISCETCHAQAHSFADHNLTFSTGINNQTGLRNSPAIINAAWQPSFMWDGGVNHIEVMPFAPITNPIEMAEDFNNLIRELNEHPRYPQMFREAFGNPEINSQKILYALAQYMSVLVSKDSKYDKVRTGNADFTEDEGAGYTLFKNHCAQCHAEPLFSDFSYRNNGLADVNGDTGRGRITLDPEDNFTFKVPTLRNISLTYPYMHDGRFRNLRQVLDHYSEGITAHHNTDPSILKSGKNGMNFSETEKQELESFLRTLTDYTFISNPHFSN